MPACLEHGGAGRPGAEPAQRVFMLAVGLMATALVFDLFDFATRTGAFGLQAYWMTAAGLVLGALAVAIELSNVPLSAGLPRMQGSASALLARSLVTALFGASWILRHPGADIPLASLALSVIGAAVVVAASLRAREPRSECPAPGDGDSARLHSRPHPAQDTLPQETGRDRAH